jgi:hypothetical protein
MHSFLKALKVLMASALGHSFFVSCGYFNIFSKCVRQKSKKKPSNHIADWMV